MTFPAYGKIKNVSNHQPVNQYGSIEITTLTIPELFPSNIGDLELWLSQNGFLESVLKPLHTSCIFSSHLSSLSIYFHIGCFRNHAPKYAMPLKWFLQSLLYTFISFMVSTPQHNSFIGDYRTITSKQSGNNKDLTAPSSLMYKHICRISLWLKILSVVANTWVSPGKSMENPWYAPFPHTHTFWYIDHYWPHQPSLHPWIPTMSLFHTIKKKTPSYTYSTSQKQYKTMLWDDVPIYFFPPSHQRDQPTVSKERVTQSRRWWSKGLRPPIEDGEFHWGNIWLVV